MDNLYCDTTVLHDDSTNVVVKRGTHLDKLQYDEFCRLCDLDGTDYGIARVEECIVIRCCDIQRHMIFSKNPEHILKDMMREYTNFSPYEVVTLVYFTIHHKYEERG